MKIKTVEERKRADIEAAIRSLYDLFPDITSCGRSKTRKVMDIKEKIAARKTELEKDSKLVALEKQLHTEQQNTMTLVKTKRHEIDGLLRKFRLRGESPELLSAVENLSKESPVVLFDENCY